MLPPRPSEIWRIARRIVDWPRFLADYGGLTSPSREYRLRAGRVFETHALDRADVATLFAVYGREEYGRVEGGSVVVDVGANIGGFSVYAADQGARVYSFEPEPSNYQLLARNVPASVATFELAVTGREEQRRLWLRTTSSHSMHEQRASEGSILVDCVSLGGALERCEVDRVDLLKVDVEGGEFEILYGDADALTAVSEIRLEYHHRAADSDPRHRLDALDDHLEEHGFSRTLLRPTSHNSGIAWYGKSP